MVTDKSSWVAQSCVNVHIQQYIVKGFNIDTVFISRLKMSVMLETSELPAVFDGVKLAAVAAALYVIVRCLNLKSPTAPPELIYQDSALARFLLKSCPLLTKE